MILTLDILALLIQSSVTLTLSCTVFFIRTARDLRIGENAVDCKRPVDPDRPTFPPPAGSWDSTRQDDYLQTTDI